MSTLAVKRTKTSLRCAKGIRFGTALLYVELTDGREIGVPLTRFPWLQRASPAQRKQWHIEPGGFAVYWDALDDGIEVEHLFE
jgi:Protein of unknown function (DUF2442)